MEKKMISLVLLLLIFSLPSSSSAQPFIKGWFLEIRDESLSPSQAIMTDGAKNLVSVDYLNQAVKTTSSPTFTGITLSGATAGQIGYFGATNNLTGSLNLTWDYTDGVMTLGDVPTIDTSTIYGFRVAKTNITEQTSFLATFQLEDNSTSTPTSNHEKFAIYAIGRTARPSATCGAGGYCADVGGIDARGYIATGNTSGRAWGGYFEASTLGTGSDGLLSGVEISVNNAYGSDQPTVGGGANTKEKFAAQLVSRDGPATAGLVFQNQGTGSGFHKGIYASQSNLLDGATDSFLEIGPLIWKVKRDGTMWIANNTSIYMRDVGGTGRSVFYLANDTAPGSLVIGNATAHLKIWIEGVGYNLTVDGGFVKATTY